MGRPETRYAKTADGVHIAYQVAGGGPLDLVYVPGWVSNIEEMCGRSPGTHGSSNGSRRSRA